MFPNLLNAPRVKYIPLPDTEENDVDVLRLAMSRAQPPSPSALGLIFSVGPNQFKQAKQTPMGLLNATFSVMKLGSSLKDGPRTSTPGKTSGTPSPPIQQPSPAPGGGTLGGRRFG
jgi:hypothetical protein